MATGVGSGTVERHLAEEMGSISVAREAARDALVAWGYRGRAEDVLLVVSELVTNALVHGAGGPTLRMTGGPRHVRIEVGDRSEQAPEPRDPGPADGWGLHVIEALCASWGIDRHEDGKVVWCELGAPLSLVAAP
ncbi:ATP-binding protein [Nonomuraea sp. MCN248]|uniref:ATP-binding protein n=1 Tax=Nonomuraea corallina TaxID=2989783 RepID=A0ABT4SG11_9ACTN|nr:ATP-binding protein [Nonomuraea corallina]MDA0636142.1 ATP-binding protein [Nonomuraea corallina]